MSTLAAVVIAVAGVAGLIGLVALMAWIGTRQAAKAAVAEHKAGEAEHVIQTERKAAVVVAEHRTADDAARRLRDGSF